MPRVVFVTDLHLTEGLDSQERFARDLEEIGSLAPRPDLVVFGGDICLWSAGAAEIFLELLRGYLIADLGTGGVELRYQAAGCSAGYQACVFAHEGRRYLNIFFGDAGEEVALRVGDGWLPLACREGLARRGRVTVRMVREEREKWIEDVPFVEEYMQSEADRAL